DCYRMREYDRSADEWIHVLDHSSSEDSARMVYRKMLALFTATMLYTNDPDWDGLFQSICRISRYMKGSSSDAPYGINSDMFLDLMECIRKEAERPLGSASHASRLFSAYEYVTFYAFTSFKNIMMHDMLIMNLIHWGKWIRHRTVAECSGDTMILNRCMCTHLCRLSEFRGMLVREIRCRGTEKIRDSADKWRADVRGYENDVLGHLGYIPKFVDSGNICEYGSASGLMAETHAFLSAYFA
ncbi:MAG: hypothetical protein ACI4Q9_00605, partial [Candidatus Methanomethylophilaceae archaeon]